MVINIGNDTSTRGRDDSVKRYQRNQRKGGGKGGGKGGNQRITRGGFNKTSSRFVGRAEKEELYTCKQRRK